MSLAVGKNDTNTVWRDAQTTIIITTASIVLTDTPLTTTNNKDTSAATILATAVASLAKDLVLNLTEEIMKTDTIEHHPRHLTRRRLRTIIILTVPDLHTSIANKGHRIVIIITIIYRTLIVSLTIRTMAINIEFHS